MNNDNRLDKIRKSIKVGDIVNGCNGYLHQWLQITEIKPIDKPILDRQNVKLDIHTKSIDRNECNTDRLYFISDILQFAIIKYDG